MLVRSFSKSEREMVFWYASSSDQSGASARRERAMGGEVGVSSSVGVGFGGCGRSSRNRINAPRKRVAMIGAGLRMTRNCKCQTPNYKLQWRGGNDRW